MIDELQKHLSLRPDKHHDSLHLLVVIISLQTDSLRRPSCPVVLTQMICGDPDERLVRFWYEALVL